MPKPPKGFTIIELIIVIAIIAVLAALVMANVTQYISKSRDTAVQANMKQLPPAATVYIANWGTVNGFCFGPEATKIANAAKAANPNYIFYCFDPSNCVKIVYSADPWMVFAMLIACNPGPQNNCLPDKWYAVTQGFKNSSGCWCVDSQGNTKDSCGSSDNCACQ
jgi:prepilin-type N-terminal cleavage/methylation domain-containing protein